MLQKIVNGIAIASGVVSLTVIGLGGYVFIRKDAIIDSVKGKVMEAVTDKLGGLGDLRWFRWRWRIRFTITIKPTPDLLNLHQNHLYHSDF